MPLSEMRAERAAQGDCASASSPGGDGCGAQPHSNTARRSWRRPLAAAGVLAMLVSLGACGDDDDGADVREIGEEDCPSGSASGSASGFGGRVGFGFRARVRFGDGLGIRLRVG